jgi:hypothetical protein
MWRVQRALHDFLRHLILETGALGKALLCQHRSASRRLLSSKRRRTLQSASFQQFADRFD